MPIKFSKSVLKTDLQTDLNTIQAYWGFDYAAGAQQITPIAVITGKDKDLGGSWEHILEEAAKAYGKFRYILDLASLYNIKVSSVPKGYTTNTRCVQGAFYNHVEKVS